MPIRIGRFEMPKRLVKDAGSGQQNYARFCAEPFESGYGRTLGNSLRRVLLSSLEGAAITAVKIEGAPHEFCSLAGVVEDVTDIVLNLKNVLFRAYTREPQRVQLAVKGPAKVTAADLQCGSQLEILNPEQPIATLDRDGRLNGELEVRIGRGYGPAERGAEDQPIGVILVDALFSPVTRVKYDVEATRVGRRTDYDRLIVEIWTDGRMTPDEALTTGAAILRHHMDVFVNYDKDLVELEDKEERVDAERDALRTLLATSVNEIELSVRAANCLNNANITTVGELAEKSEVEMLKYRNFGKKSLKEIKDKLTEMGLSLGMTFDPGLLRTQDEA